MYRGIIPFYGLTVAVRSVSYLSSAILVYIYIYTVTTFKYVEGGPDREAPEVAMKYQFVYLNVVTV